MNQRNDMSERVMRLARNPILLMMAEGYRRLEAWWCRHLFHCSA